MVAHIDEVPAGAANDAQAVLQLGAAIASEGTENIAGGAFGVDAYRGRSPVLGGYGGAVTVEGAGADVLGAVRKSPGAQTEQTLRGGYGDLFGAFYQQRAGVGHHVEGADSVAFSELGGDAQGFGAELFSLRLNRLDQGARFCQGDSRGGAQLCGSA